jgi:hypothetical protein
MAVRDCHEEERAMEQANRGAVLTTFAILFAVLAISNFLKPLQLDAQTGFVFFGTRLTGTTNQIMGPLFGIFLAEYAAAIWNMRRYALWMGSRYAIYVVLNLIFFNVKYGAGGSGGLLFGIVYIAIAVGVSSGAAYILFRRKAELT